MLDLAIAISALLLLSLVAGALWAAQAFLGLQSRGALPADPAGWVQALGQPNALTMIWMTLAGTGGSALLVYFWRRPASADERSRARRAMFRWVTWGWILASGLAAFLFSTAMSAAAVAVGVEPQPSNQTVIEAALTVSPWLMWVFGVLIAPAYEELLFRRVLFGRLWAAGRPWLGLLLSSAAFAFMHEIPGLSGNDWQATAVLWSTYGFMGGAFALVYWRTQTLWAAILAHALNNAIALALLNLYGAA